MLRSTTHWLWMLTSLAFLFFHGSPSALAQSAAVKAKAKAHYMKGKQAFDRQEYASALTEYERAYQTLPLPGLLFNIGQCHRNLGHDAEAVKAFKLYLEKSPDADNRAAVEKLIEEMETRLAAAPPSRPDGTDPVDPEPDPDQAEPDPRVEDPDPKKTTASLLATRTPPARARHRAPFSPPHDTPFYRSWWFWTVVGAVVAGGAATGIYFGTRSHGPDIPGSDLGVLDFSR